MDSSSRGSYLGGGHSATDSQPDQQAASHQDKTSSSRTRTTTSRPTTGARLEATEEAQSNKMASKSKPQGVRTNRVRRAACSPPTLSRHDATVPTTPLVGCGWLLALTLAASGALALSPAEVHERVHFEPTRGPSLAPPMARMDGPSKSFARINELDAFLEEMNHKELGQVASGEPIRDLFMPKLVVASDNKPQHERGHDKDAQSGLAGSHSERQVYSDCALILQRTFVKNIDDPHHQVLPYGKTEQACISYKQIDKAVEEAKHKLKFRDLEVDQRKRKSIEGIFNEMQPVQVESPLAQLHTSLEPPVELIAALGEINMATTQILADQFDLSNDELLNGLPLIDMSRTKFWPMCPLLVKQDIKCELTRFRTLTGHCNNIKHPTWGAAMTPFARYLPPIHPDGIWVPRKSIITELTFHMSAHEPHSVMLRHDQLGGGPAGHEAHPSHLSTVVDHESEPEMSSIDGDTMAGAASVHFASHAHSPDDHDEQEYDDQPSATKPFERRPLAVGSQSRVHFAEPSRPSPDEPAVKLEAQASQGQHRSRPLPVELPSARLISSVVHHDVDLPHPDLSILFMSWGQLLDHDMTRAAVPPANFKCCANDGQPKNKLCLPIKVPENDPFYTKFDVSCLEFRRSLAGLRPNCVLGPRVHQNAITAPIDANFVYGSSMATADSLRLFKGGRLRDRDWFKRQNLKPLLPAQEQNPDDDCLGRPSNLFCFVAGDVRVNEQTHLTVLHTLYMREHNAIADKLAELNPHWDDERTFQETRHIVAAGVQNVLINEYIPLLIGKKMAQLYNLTGQPYASGHQQAHWHGYDPSVTTSVSNSFAAAAFRFGHTFIQSTVERYNKFHEFVASEKLRRLFKQPFLIYQPGVLDELTGGMVNQASQSHDPFISQEVSGHLFQPPEAQFGHDLPSINLQRGREQGLPGYNLFREWCGLPRAETFDQLAPYLTNHTAYQYSRLYKHVDDIDLWSGGISERRLPGAAIGPTFACIIARQFSNTRRGDRFWFENPGFPSSFTPEQLAQVRKISLAKILCANSDDLPTIQRWPLRMAHPVLNPRLPCDQIAHPDLRYWQEE